MVLKKVLVFLALVILSPPTTLFALQISPEEEEQRYEQLNKIVYHLYDNFESKESNAQDLKDAWELLQCYPEDPYIYDLWATTEWVLLGHELGTGLDQQKEISEFPALAERAKRYHEVVGHGLKLTDNKNDPKNQLARAILFFSQAKFTFSFESDFSGLSRADKETAEGIKLLKRILEKDSTFGPAYFFLGTTRYGLAAKTEAWSPKRLVIRLKSYTYDELYYIDSDVFNKSSALEWMEKAYYYNASSWLKKIWLESAMLLFKVYPDYRKSLKLNQELEILETKEIILLERLAEILPHRQDLIQQLKLSKLRVKIIKDYLSSLKK